MSTFKRVEGQSADGTRWWANVEYDNQGNCLGADAHWLSPELADKALASMNRKTEAHKVATQMLGNLAFATCLCGWTYSSEFEEFVIEAVEVHTEGEQSW